MLTRRSLLGTAAALFVPVDAGATVAAPEIIEAIIDNGGTVTEDGAADLNRDLLAGLADLPGRAFRDVRIDLMTTSRPYTVWSGTSDDLNVQGRQVLDLVVLNDHCSDLGRAFDQADQNLRVARPESACLLVCS
ncbi:MAG: hypothetical protein KC777_25590, partial [Cyanobacteria bacterium HKST-UBA02]|nr:hypothetical protein [Cyanobacteria bacterium HKST-UBA02]